MTGNSDGKRVRVSAPVKNARDFMNPTVPEVMRQITGPEERKALCEAFLKASQPAPTAEPLDWMESTTPKRWRFGREEVTYDWGE